MNKLGHLLLAHPRNAIIAALICLVLQMIGLPGGFLIAILVGLVTLQNGSKNGFWILAWVALPAVALFFLHRVGGFDFLLARAVLIWLLASLLHMYRSWRLVLEVAVVIGVTVIIALHLTIGDMTQWWMVHIKQYISEMGKVTSWKLSADEIKLLISRLAPIASGLLAFFVLFGAFVQLVIARWWQSAMFKPGALRQEFNNIRMGQTFSILLALIIIATFFKVSLVIDILPVALLPFMVAGLSLLHAFVGLKKRLALALILIYAGLIFLPYVVVLLLSFVGYIDSWYNFRKLIVKEG